MEVIASVGYEGSMNSNDIHLLSDQLIEDYWIEFERGRTWNFYLSSERLVLGDTWKNKNDFTELAIKNIAQGKNILQALEILMVENREFYYSQAEEIISSWYESGANDPNYYFDILVHLDKENIFREYFFGAQNVHLYLSEDDGTGWCQAARSSLLRVGDEVTCKAIANKITDIFCSENVDEKDIENIGLGFLVEMGELANQYLNSEVIGLAKDFCRSYLEHDERYILEEVELGRKDPNSILWLRNDIAYISWRLGWMDVINELKQTEWYWASIFGEEWSDPNNRELLVWSLYEDNQILRNRCVAVMTSDPYSRIDGAIAWKRITAREKNK